MRWSEGRSTSAATASNVYAEPKQQVDSCSATAVGSGAFVRLDGCYGGEEHFFENLKEMMLHFLILE